MVKIEEVIGGSVQFHFDVGEVLRKIVVIANGVTSVYDDKDVLAMLKIWDYAGAPLESDKMAVDLVNGFVTRGEDEKGALCIFYSTPDRDIRCTVGGLELTED